MREYPQSSAPDSFSSVHIPEVWERLGGSELQNGRGRAFYRGGDGLSVTFDLERQCWFDHAAGVGGVVLALIQTALNCDRRTALAWLTTEGFLEARTYSPEDRRRYARRRNAASAMALDIEYWRTAFAEQLNGRKISAVASGDDELERTARLCHLIENGLPEALAREFFRQRKTNPEGTARLIEAGRQFQNESRQFAALVVTTLAEESVGAQ